MINDSLTKLYVELTTSCNLDCVMCVRRTWKDEGYGPMSWDLYQRLIDQLREFPRPPIIHFGGYGEPMTYPWFLQAIELAKGIGAPVEMTTNGTMLTPELAQALIDLDVDKIMVSIDGVSPEVYGDIRIHSDFRKVIDNFIELFRRKVSQRGRGRH
jgi:MoaA/NifB/PqqE/SkfB family radical SAM enzyme